MFSEGDSLVDWLGPCTIWGVGADEHDTIPATIDPNAMKPARHPSTIFQRMGFCISFDPTIELGHPGR